MVTSLVIGDLKLTDNLPQGNQGNVKNSSGMLRYLLERELLNSKVSEA